MTLSEKMLLYRAKHNINQEELARRCNLTKQTICLIETEQQTPTKRTELKIRLVVDEVEQ